MAIYVINYIYDERLRQLRQDNRPAHRKFLRNLHEEGINIGSGYLRDAMTEGALIIMQADTAAQALNILENDPFYINGLIKDRTAKEWEPTIGALAPDFDTEFPVS